METSFNAIKETHVALVRTSKESRQKRYLVYLFRFPNNLHPLSGRPDYQASP